MEAGGEKFVEDTAPEEGGGAGSAWKAAEGEVERTWNLLYSQKLSES